MKNYWKNILFYFPLCGFLAISTEGCGRQRQTTQASLGSEELTLPPGLGAALVLHDNYSGPIVNENGDVECNINRTIDVTGKISVTCRVDASVVGGFNVSDQSCPYQHTYDPYGTITCSTTSSVNGGGGQSVVEFDTSFVCDKDFNETVTIDTVCAQLFFGDYYDFYAIQDKCNCGFLP